MLSDSQLKAVQRAADNLLKHSNQIYQAQRIMEQNRSAIDSAFNAQAKYAQSMKQWESIRKNSLLPAIQQAQRIMEQNRSAIDSAFSAQAKFAQSMKQWDSIRKNSLLPAIQKAMETFRVQQRQHQYLKQAIQSITDSLPPAGLNKLIQLINNPEVIFEPSNRHALFCYRFGWPPLEHIPTIKVGYVEETLANYSEQEAQRIIDEEVLKVHDEQLLHDRLKEWKGCEFLKERVPILEAAVKAHIEGKYYLSVPALLPQFEGIIIERYGLTGHIKQKDLKDTYSVLLSDHKYLRKYELVRDLILNQLLDNFEHGEAPPADLNRHAILHGADTQYGKEIVSLKTILIFDFVASKLKEMDENNEDESDQGEHE